MKTRDRFWFFGFKFTFFDFVQISFSFFSGEYLKEYIQFSFRLSHPHSSIWLLLKFVLNLFFNTFPALINISRTSYSRRIISLHTLFRSSLVFSSFCFCLFTDTFVYLNAVYLSPVMSFTVEENNGVWVCSSFPMLFFLPGMDVGCNLQFKQQSIPGSKDGYLLCLPKWPLLNRKDHYQDGIPQFCVWRNWGLGT